MVKVLRTKRIFAGLSIAYLEPFRGIDITIVIPEGNSSLVSCHTFGKCTVKNVNYTFVIIQ